MVVQCRCRMIKWCIFCVTHKQRWWIKRGWLLEGCQCILCTGNTGARTDKEIEAEIDKIPGKQVMNQWVNSADTSLAWINGCMVESFKLDFTHTLQSTSSSMQRLKYFTNISYISMYSPKILICKSHKNQFQNFSNVTF